MVDLDLTENGAWDEESNEVDAALASEKRRHLEEKRRQRQMEHEKRLAEKRNK